MRFAACGMKHAAFGLRPVASGIRYVACGAGVDKDWRRWAVDTLLAAIDGGGSSTRVWVLSAAGEFLAEGRSGPSTVTVVGAEAAGRAVAEAARAAGLSAGDWPGGGANVAVVAAIMAGVETEPEYSQFLAELQRRFPDSAVVLRHDATGALLAGTMGDPGVMILSGTGSVCVSMGPGGELVRAGGWGHVVGDEGSGYWIGKEAMRRAIRAADGRGPATALTERLCQAAGVKHILDVFGPVTRGDFDRPWIARLAPLVAQTAAEGDPVANAIMDEAAYELALHVASVIRRAPWFADVDAVPTVTAGGVFGLGADWYHRVKQALAREAPRARLTVWVKEPILGAVYLALKELYGDIPGHVRQRLVELRARYVEPIP